MQNLRNVAIIAGLALIVAVAPGGDAAAETLLTAISIAFLTAIALAVYRLYMSQQLVLSTLSDGRRTLLYGAVGAITLLIAGFEQFEGSSGGLLLWVMLMALAAVAIFRVYRDATRYT